MKAADSLYSEFRAVDILVAQNTARVLKAYQNARVGYHVSERMIRYFMENGILMNGIYSIYTWQRFVDEHCCSSSLICG